VKDVSLPDWEPTVEAAKILVRCQAAAEYRDILATRAADLIPEVRERLEAGMATPAPDYIAAWRTARRLRRALDALLVEIDVLALPGRDQLAPRMEASGRLVDPLSPRNFTSPLNPTALPGLTFPCGFSTEGLPIGLQLAGRPWEEGTLLRVAHAYQRVTDWHARRPPLPA
jgi:aspartyl-tRNA(Asn)/glutamyl-tRNA(Gln) amidotransferase subunit A